MLAGSVSSSYSADVYSLGMVREIHTLDLHELWLLNALVFPPDLFGKYHPTTGVDAHTHKTCRKSSPGTSPIMNYSESRRFIPP